MIVVAMVLSFWSSALPLEAGFRDPALPPGLVVHGDDPVVGPMQRRLVRRIARTISEEGYSSRGARFQLPAKGETPEAVVFASTDGFVIRPVELRVDLGGEAPRVVRADTVRRREYPRADSTRFDLAATYFSEGRFVDGHRELAPLVAEGYPEAIFLKGTAFLDGFGVTRDCKAAETYLARAVDSGVSPAHATLGRLLLDGPCANPVRGTEAFHHLVEAGERGVSSSMTFTGIELLSGRTLPRSIPMAVFHLAMAERNRDPHAREILADMRTRVPAAEMARATAEGRLRWERHHLGLRELPTGATCRADVATDSVVPCAARSGVLLRLEFDGIPVALDATASQRILLQVARGQIDEATASIREALGCLQDEALDVYEALKARVPALPGVKSPQDAPVPL